MATLAYLLTQNWEWRGSQVRVLRVIRDPAGFESSMQAVQSLIEAARIRAEASVIVSTDPFGELLRRHSGEVDVVFLGLQTSEAESAGDLYDRMTVLLESMPTTILVHSCGEADVFA